MYRNAHFQIYLNSAILDKLPVSGYLNMIKASKAVSDA